MTTADVDFNKPKTDSGSSESADADGAAAREKAAHMAEIRRGLEGRSYIKRLQEFLGSLRRTHEHHNRTLYYDDIVTLLLLGFYNHKIRSLRLLDLASQIPAVRKYTRAGRVSRSALSEGLQLFDSQSLMPLIRELSEALPAGPNVEPEFQELYQKLVAFDGSYFRVPAKVLWALRERTCTGVEGRQIRLNLHYCLRTGHPMGMSISGEGGLSEAQAVLKGAQPGLIYIGDRGVFSHAAVKGMVGAGADFVFRIQDAVGFTCEQERVLSEEDRNHRLISDRQGRLTGSNRHKPPEMVLREIRIVHADAPEQTIRLLTNLLTVPASVIGEMYQERWQIEVFFRWLKMYANFEHMISHSERGMETWFYVAFIATLLMSLYTGYEPNTYTFAAMQMIMAGEARYEDVAAHLARINREKMLARQRRAAQKTAKKNA